MGILSAHVRDDLSSAHSRPQRPRSFWSAPRIATSGPRPEVAILGADQKERGLWGRE